jgi:hypothetical protein
LVEAQFVTMSSGMNLRSECEILLRRFGVPAVGLARIGPAGVESLGCLGERKLGAGIMGNPAT